MTDTSAQPTSADVPIEKWIENERKRQVEREAQRRAAEGDRDGRTKLADRRVPWVDI